LRTHRLLQPAELPVSDAEVVQRLDVIWIDAETLFEPVDQMVDGRTLARHLVQQPERGMNQRIVLLRRPGIEPDAPQTVGASQGRRGDVRVIVLDEAAAPRRAIREQRRRHQRGIEPPDSRCEGCGCQKR
jgi:hypothetical protein